MIKEYDMLPEIYMRLVTKNVSCRIADSGSTEHACEHMLKVAKIAASVYYNSSQDCE
jgi:hypothetical protein